jgi:type II secretory pathway pseudopilin PulG
MKDRNVSGFSLVELLVAVALLVGVFAIIFPQYISLTRHSAVTRKMIKTQADAYNNLEQMFKDIASAGFGLPAVSDNLPSGATSCLRTADKAIEIKADNNGSVSIIIRSTAAGDKKEVGAWGVVSIDSNSNVTLSYSSMVFKDDYLMILDTASEKFKKLGLLKFDANSRLSLVEQYSDLQTLNGKIAYWIPDKDKVCYTTRFYLADYGSNDPKPDICAPNGKKLMRSKDPPDGPSGSAPIMDCVHDQGLAFLIGCVGSTSGIEWLDPTKGSCPSSMIPRLVRVGVVVQAGPREKDKISPESLILFSGIVDGSGSSLSKDIKLSDENENNDKRYYRWITLEKTIFLVNLEKSEE